VGIDEPENDGDDKDKDSCIVPSHPIPADELSRYGVERDPHLEQDIANYVHTHAPDEVIQNVEKVKQEIVLGSLYEIWEVTTDKDRWWIITNLTNNYSQRHFPSLDYTLSFHIGLMMRLRSRPDGANSQDPNPFDEVFRRQEQAKNRHDNAVEAEDYQAVGMLLRECLISLVGVLRRRVRMKPEVKRPQIANFVSWIALVMDELCGGRSNKELRKHLKNTAKETWQFVTGSLMTGRQIKPLLSSRFTRAIASWGTACGFLNARGRIGLNNVPYAGLVTSVHISIFR
jgi:hypothetical protein